MINTYDTYTPKTLNRAIILLVSYLSMRDRRKIRNMPESDLVNLNFSLGLFIKDEFKLGGNDSLIAACRSVSGKDNVDIDDASAIIIKELWKRLRVLPN
jgi:hypothetical protein